VSPGRLQAQDGGDPAAPVVLTPAQDRYALGSRMEILADRTGELSVAAVRSPEFAGQFAPSASALPVFGFSNAAYWARVAVHNASSEPLWILTLSETLPEQVDYYLYGEDGEEIAARKTGSSLPFDARDLPSANLAFRAPIPPGENATIYLRIAGQNPLRFPLALVTLPAYVRGADVGQLLWASVYGFLILMAVYNLLIFGSLRDRNYLLLAAFIVPLTVTLMLRDGRAEQYLWPHHPEARRLVIPLAIGLVQITLILFSVSFLRTRAYVPWLHKVLLFLLVALIAATLLVIPMALGWPDFRTVLVILIALGFPTVVLLAIAGPLVWRRGHGAARYYVAAEFVPLLFGVLDLLFILGIVSVPAFTVLIPRLGNVLLVLLFSVALADSVKELNLMAQKATAARLASERLSRQYLDAMPLGVAVYDPGLNLLYANDAASALVGNAQPGLRESSADAALRYPVYRTGTDDPYPFEELPVSSSLGGRSATRDDISLDIEGRRVPLQVWSTPLRDGEETLQAVVVVLADITEKKRAELELRRYQDELEGLVAERTRELSQANDALLAKQRVADTLSEAARLLNAGPGLRPMLNRILELLGRIIAHDGAGIFLDDGDEIVMVGATGQAQNSLGRRLSVESRDPRARVYREGRVIRLDAPDPDAGRPGRSEGLRSCRWIGLPLSVEGKTFGVLDIEGDVLCSYPESDLVVLEAFAAQAAAAVWIARLYEQAQASAATAERERLARDLHDAVTQTLFSASIFADMLPVQMEQEPAQAVKNLEKLSQLIRSALAEMRALLMELRPAALTAGDPNQLVGNLLQAAMARSRVRFSYTVHGAAASPLPSEVQIGIYRIVQETLNNVVKHSGASACTVDLWYRPDGLEIAIRDDGRGFDPQAVSPEHMGLAIMQERARAIGSDLAIASQPGQGVCVRVAWLDQRG
jgi:signal transduction histidine kinase